MDVYGCLVPDTWIDRMFLWFLVVCITFVALLGFPFIIWVAVCGETLCLAH